MKGKDDRTETIKVKRHELNSKTSDMAKGREHTGKTLHSI